MLDLKEIREAYEELSGKASEIGRQLNFAGIGIVWIFNKTTDLSKLDVNLPVQLIFPLFLLCGSLALDLLQYFLSTLIWYGYYLANHRKDQEDQTKKIEESEWINLLPWGFWVLKLVLTGWAYVLLALYLFNL